jgi:Mechanosensitive ion channel, conserved TM helix
VLRIHRVVGRFRWARGFGKGDIRHALYNMVGGLGFVIVFFVFLNAALDAMKLGVLSGLIERGVYFIPKLIIAVVILGLGWVVAGWLAEAALRALRSEEVPGASRIAKFARLVLQLFFSAMALTELDIARQIVVIGFSVSIITLGVLAVVVTALHGRRVLERGSKRED